MSLSNLHSHVALWLRLVENPSHGVLSSIPTSYLDSAKRSQAPYAATLVSLAVLHQCRLEVLSITEDLKSTGSWAALNDSQTQLSHLRLRFRRSMKEIGGSLTQHVSHMTASDTPFGKVQWEKTGTHSPASSADSDGEEKMTDSEDESSDEADLEEDAEYEPEEQDEYTDSEGPLSKFGQVESEAVSGPRFQGTRQMHALYNSVTVCRLGRLIANVQQSEAEALAKLLEKESCAADVKAAQLARLRSAASNARMTWAREMQKEMETAEQYRVAIIQVLQEEIRR
ncbi:hypothetical protein MPH_06001 [Macrophomina phaseolina MS6]|uniref:Uncharacterized protein n=1 Tax=Macrophomina phaseolina (strain MS6) TaxID=1126212 RepID=K2RPW2_MACPH|nr:hypothetical protein MPH_06001 [Macrophomina phaseolina MS6]